MNWRYLASLALLLALALLLVRVQSDRRPPFSGLRAVTVDEGLSTHPSVSPDGKMLAYASDRSGEGHLDIFVKMLPDGKPRRLTNDPATDEHPDISPDGRFVVFESDREPPGIYVVSVNGGRALALASHGHDAKISPDGRLVAYWRGTGWRSLSHPRKIHVVPVLGGESREVVSGFTDARYPVWSPDGRHLLFSAAPRLSPWGDLDSLPTILPRGKRTGGLRRWKAVLRCLPEGRHLPGYWHGRATMCSSPSSAVLGKTCP